LDEMQKDVTVEQARKAIKLTKKVGIFTTANILMGMPGESPETMRETVEFVKETNPLVASIHLLVPLPNTEVYDYAIKHKKIKDENKYLMKMGDWWKEQGIFREIQTNLTSMSDEELQKLKTESEVEIRKHYKKTHRLTMNPLYKFLRTWQVYNFKFATSRALDRLKTRKKTWEIDKKNFGKLK
jgi:radical SAM superfamily enzyme YgiQ (UPF0313 family)